MSYIANFFDMTDPEYNEINSFSLLHWNIPLPTIQKLLNYGHYCDSIVIDFTNLE